MPRAFNAHPKHPAVAYLLRLHADIGGQILENRKQAKRLAADMRHVEAVIKMYDPAFSLKPIAVRRRKPNPWFKRGDMFRRALDVLRLADRPLTARQIAERMIAARGIADSDRKRVRDLVGAVNFKPAEPGRRCRGKCWRRDAGKVGNPECRLDF